MIYGVEQQRSARRPIPHTAQRPRNLNSLPVKLGDGCGVEKRTTGVKGMTGNTGSEMRESERAKRGSAPFLVRPRLFGTNMAYIQQMAPNARAGNHRRFDPQTQELVPPREGVFATGIGRRARKGDNTGKGNMLSDGTGKAQAPPKGKKPPGTYVSRTEAPPNAYLWHTAHSSTSNYRIVIECNVPVTQGRRPFNSVSSKKWWGTPLSRHEVCWKSSVGSAREESMDRPVYNADEVLYNQPRAFNKKAVGRVNNQGDIRRGRKVTSVLPRSVHLQACQFQLDNLTATWSTRAEIESTHPYPRRQECPGSIHKREYTSGFQRTSAFSPT